mgnify:CR=1 FL=1
MKINIRLIYLYLFSFIGLLVVVIGAIKMVDLGMKVFVFKDADRYEYTMPEMSDEERKLVKVNAEKDTKRNREREFSNSLAMIIVGLPLYLYHWKTIKKENKSG